MQDPMRSPRAEQETRQGLWSRSWVVALLVTAAILAYHANFSTEHVFLKWDDHSNIVDNPGFKGLSAQNLKWMFTAHHLGVYEPVSWLTKALQYAAFGLSARGFHLVTLVFHIITTLLLFLISTRLLPLVFAQASRETIRVGATVSAFAFAVHPLRVEIVAWASGQSYALAALFSVLAIWAYLRHCARKAPWTSWLWLSMSAYCLAVLSKSTAVMLPFMLLALDYYPLRRLGWRNAIFEKAPYYAVAVTVVMVAVEATQGAQDLSEPVFNSCEKLARACYAAVFYLGKTIWPAGILPHYPVPRQGLALTAPQYLLSCLSVFTITVTAYVKRRAWPWLAACWFAYIAVLAPVLGFVQHGTQIMAADRYAYLSAFPLVLLVGAAVMYVSKGSCHPAFRHGIASALAILMIGLTVQQMRIWRNTETLWRHVVELDGSNVFACNNLGNLLMEEQRYESAAEVLERGFALEPTKMKLVLNYGVSLEKLKQFGLAARVYTKALEHHPKNPLVQNNLGVIMLNLGDLKAAEHHFREALSDSPQFALARENLQRLLDDTRPAGAVPIR